MNHTFARFSLTATLQSLLHWLTTTQQSSQASANTAAIPLRAQLMQSTTPTRQVPQTRPLRVLQVMELGHSGRQPGRLRISGRMADVCAELDRLAAHEAMQM